MHNIKLFLYLLYKTFPSMTENDLKLHGPSLTVLETHNKNVPESLSKVRNFYELSVKILAYAYIQQSVNCTIDRLCLRTCK